MPASADIYGLIKPIETPNRLAELAQVAQLQNAQLGQQRNQLEMAEFARTAARQNKLAELAAQGPDALRKGGFVKEAAAIEKDNEELLTKRQDRMVKGVGFWRDNVNSLRTPEQAAQFVQAMYADPNLKDSPITKLPIESFLPQSADPAAFDLWKKEFALGATKFIEMNKPQVTTQNLGGTTQMVATPGLGGAPQVIATSQNTASPGDVLASQDRRAALAENKRHHGVVENQPRGQFIETTNGYVLADPRNPNNVRPVMGPDGQPLKGKAADRSLNETQAKANLFGTRMHESNRILSTLEDEGVTNSGLIKNALQGAVGLTPFIGDKLSDAAGSVMNTVPGVLGGPNASQQRVDQAQRDFINAALRRESGAAIADSEFANAKRQYFPQPGDSKEVIAQKRRNRELAIRGLEVEVPGGFRSTPTPAAGNGQSGGAGKVVDFGSLK